MQEMARPHKPWYRKQTKQWYVELDGKQHPLGPDKQEAMRLCHEVLASRPKLPNNRVVVILDKFLEWTQAYRSPKTYRWYRDFLQAFADDHPSLTLRDLKPYHVEEWASRGKAKRGKITAMKTALNWAVRQGHIESSPIAHMERPEAGSRAETLTPEEFEKVLAHVKDSQFRELLEFSWEAGVRPQESKAIEARYLDPTKACCIIPAGEVKGKRRTRVVYLTEKALAILKRLAKKYPNGKVFRNRRGNEWTADAVRCRFKRLEAKVGKRYCQYMFRHTWITRKLIAGVDSHVVAKLAGHTDTKMLDRVYSHIADDYEFMLREARKESRLSNGEDEK
jgi:integrase